MQLWRFNEGVPRWTVEVDGVPEIGQISPTAVRLVTLHTNTTDRLSRVCVWNIQNGQLDAQPKSVPPPLDVKFVSDAEFCTLYDVECIPYTVSSS